MMIQSLLYSILPSLTKSSGKCGNLGTRSQLHEWMIMKSPHQKKLSDDISSVMKENYSLGVTG